jgi:hypothetical protein
MPVTPDCTRAPFVRCGKKLKLISDGGDCGNKKCEPGYDGVWQNLRLAGIWTCAGAFAGI